MRDEEIIEVLELCCTQDGSIPCYDCPCWDDGVQKCEGLNHADLLGLINRQKAEIEKLNKKVEELSEVLSESIRIRYAEVKSEAYKEFAERLTSIGKQDGAYDLVSVFEIAELLKEMVGKEE